MNHTQGKWVANDVHYLSVDRLIKSEGEIITNEIRSDKNGEFIAVAPREANARLIASAPDLLNACKHLVSILGEENEDFYNKHIEAFNLGMAAITKAEDINHG